MAKATKGLRTVEKIVEEERVTLEMTVNEAGTLYRILAAVGGSPTQSRRKYADSVRRALVDVVGDNACYDDLEVRFGGLFFKNGVITGD